MLQTQINYWQYKEAQTHNRATESQAAKELEEQVRHNQLTERLGFFNYAETAKHNRATEDVARENVKLGWFNAAETKRSHLQQERIGYGNLSVARTNAATNARNAQTQAYNALTQARKVGYDNINTQYANRTNRMNAYNNQANTVVRQQELLQTKRANDIKEASIPAQYLNLMPQPKIDVVRKVTRSKTITKKVH